MSVTARTWLKTWNKYWIIDKFRIIHGMHRPSYLCVTARAMSLLTVCGELRCTVMLSGGGQDRRIQNLSWKKHLRRNCANVIHPIVAMLSFVKILLKGLKMSHSTWAATCRWMLDSLLMTLCSSRRVGVPGRVYDVVVPVGVAPGVRVGMMW